ncbi:MAG: hypothetical protein ACYDAY_11580 [Candidatus Dormibacteria bacterium]
MARSVTNACRDCGAPIIFARSTTTGKTAPVDAKPDPTGNIVLFDHGPRKHTYAVVGVAEFADMLRFTSHFQTCPVMQQRRAAQVARSTHREAV